ncbi:putative gibberellin regulated protein [Helianthus annuus]|uniref:Gibberellin regulated protein n=1 Tax=Helianthus annuus TaxID=4232 RepID=A0A251SBS2_HELAN|nr:gibberellin-regulated protein 2 [Helianthus annuus]KAF5764286.1 putative gibberellin regulated protein [Helianthus annuus]KAJ0831016.1 putative gibberellin regulated protein [Helianthus annuus]
MASTSYTLLLLLLLISLFQVSFSSSSETHEHRLQAVKGANRRLLTLVDCEGLCATRCGKHSRPNVCTRACGTCCKRCNCVPPGTHGNRELCGSCYTDMLTHGNRLKCP